MKKTISTGCFALISLLAVAQNKTGNEIPAAVKNAFAKQYPAASKVKWDKEEKNYEVSFVLDKKDNSILFNKDGQVLETETAIESNELPAAALNYVKANYSGQHIKEMAKIKDKDGKLTYEVEVKSGDLIFDSNGVFVKKMKP